MNIWQAIALTLGLFSGGILLFILALEGLKRLLLSINRTWHTLNNYPEPVPPFGLALVGPCLTDKQGNIHFGFYLVEYDRQSRVARALCIVKPKLSNIPLP